MSVPVDEITRLKREAFVQSQMRKGATDADALMRQAEQFIFPENIYYAQMPTQLLPVTYSEDKPAHSIKKILKKVEKATIRPISNFIDMTAKKATPAATAAVGNYILPGIGAPIGGALGGASTRGPGNRVEGATEGAGQGLGYLAGSNAGSMLSNLQNGQPLMRQQPGNINDANQRIPDNAVVPPAFRRIPSAPNLGNLRNLIPNNIFGSIQDLIEGRRKERAEAEGMAQAQQAPQEEQIFGGGAPFSPQGMQQARETDLSALTPPPMSPYEVLMSLSPKHRKKKGDKEKIEAVEPIKHYATGGHAHVGLIKESDTGGQADDIPKNIPEGSYVMNATDVSLLGDGSSDNGAKKLREFESKFARSGITKPYDAHSRAIAAKVSNDEYVMSPDTVNALGQGNNNKGAKVIDKMRNNLRKQKGVAKILPPKTKNLHAYMKGGR